jgi:hypothetical protein
MRNRTNLVYATVLLLFAVIFTGSCKKDSSDPAPVDPVFTITASTVNLQAGGLGLQFTAKCTNTDVKMTHVLITDPVTSGNMTYDFSGASYTKNEAFGLQEDNTAYVKNTGTWKFNFVGTRKSDGVAFAVDATLAVSK